MVLPTEVLLVSLLVLFLVVDSFLFELIRLLPFLLSSLRRDDGGREEEARLLRPAAACGAGATTPRASAGTEGMLSWSS